jgi:hypothetical protein
MPSAQSGPAELGFLEGIIDDGRPLLQLTAMALFLSGLFALFLAVRREFLPHDIAYLGISAADLCAVAGCRVVGFMFHDRVAFGGTLMAIAILYLWMAAFPMRQGYTWPWWAFLVSGMVGFGSFLSYLGYGYLDSWHGIATLALFPVFVAGLIRTRPLGRRRVGGWLREPDGLASPRLQRVGRSGLVLTGLGMVAAGLIILVVGATRVFVPQDLAFIGLTSQDLDVLNPHLVPLIAHDRSGFGGGLAAAGLLVAMCAWYSPPTTSFRQAVGVSGAVGFGCAIGIHYLEGYTDLSHLGPALAGATIFAASALLESLGARLPRRLDEADPAIPPRSA